LKQLPSFFGSPGDEDNLWQEAYEFNFKGTALGYRAILNLVMEFFQPLPLAVSVSPSYV